MRLPSYLAFIKTAWTSSNIASKTKKLITMKFTIMILLVSCLYEFPNFNSNVEFDTLIFLYSFGSKWPFSIDFFTVSCSDFFIMLAVSKASNRACSFLSLWWNSTFILLQQSFWKCKTRCTLKFINLLFWKWIHSLTYLKFFGSFLYQFLKFVSWNADFAFSRCKWVPS